MSAPMDSPQSEAKVHRGLKGVYFDRSGLSSIDRRADALLRKGTRVTAQVPTIIAVQAAYPQRPESPSRRTTQ